LRELPVGSSDSPRCLPRHGLEVLADLAICGLVTIIPSNKCESRSRCSRRQHLTHGDRDLSYGVQVHVRNTSLTIFNHGSTPFLKATHTTSLPCVSHPGCALYASRLPAVQCSKASHCCIPGTK